MHPLLDRRLYRSLPGRREDVSDRLPGQVLREFAGPRLDRCLEAGRLQVLFDQDQAVAEHVLNDMVDVRHHFRSQHLTQRATLDIEDIVQETGEPPVEGIPELGPGEDPGDVVLGEQPRADCTPDGGRESGLVLGDDALQ